jgi:hypothetical protein
MIALCSALWVFSMYAMLMVFGGTNKQFSLRWLFLLIAVTSIFLGTTSYLFVTLLAPN